MSCNLYTRYLMESCQTAPLRIPTSEMRKLRHREVKCFVQDHTDSGDELPEPPPLTPLLCGPPRGNGTRPCEHRHIARGAGEEKERRRDGAVNTVGRRELPEPGDRGGVEVLCGCCPLCLVCSRSLGPPACVTELSSLLSLPPRPCPTARTPCPGLDMPKALLTAPPCPS